MTLAEQLAALTHDERIELLGSLSAPALASMQFDWRVWARPEQQTPVGDWRVWLLLAGRGWGKTRTGAEDAKRYGLANPGARIGIIAPTYADARDTCVEGESGLLAVMPPKAVRFYNRSMGEIRLHNGARYKMFSADEPARLRGPQHNRLWADELAAWTDHETWHMAMMGLRLGDNPQAVVTTTPRPLMLIRELMADPLTHVTTGSTYDNRVNLAETFFSRVIRQYEGTRLGRQELLAEILDDFEGALWTHAMIDDARVAVAPELTRVVVAIDPAVTANADSDETGLCVAGLGIDGEYYVLDLHGVTMSPHGWATRAVNLFDKHAADRIIAEVNNGGDMVIETIRHVRAELPVKSIHASRGKTARAEPVAALYEQGRVHHCGTFGAGEDQMCGFPVSDGLDDQVDALVWALSELSGSRAEFGVTLLP